LETQAHHNLKRLALIWAQRQDYAVCGHEVRLPRSNYRADLAAYRPSRKGGVATTAVFECKQSRSDFLKDSHAAELVLKQLAPLEERRRKLEELLGMHLPSLRKGEALFQEYDAFDFSGLEHKTYRRVLREIQVLQNRLYGKTKFDKISRYGIANLCYLVIDDGILKDHEVPLNWGVLAHQNGQLQLQRKPVWQKVATDLQAQLLIQIAKTGTRRLNTEFGVSAADMLCKGHLI
jgi:hypothetical protein